jgi:hypothetical protein
MTPDEMKLATDAFLAAVIAEQLVKISNAAIDAR